MKHILTVPSHPVVSGPVVLCLGFFDGLHRGHQALVQSAIELATQLQATPALLTFDPHPAVVLGKAQKETLLTSVDDRDELVYHHGIHHVFVLPFTHEVAHLDPLVFLNTILIPLDVVGVVCGEDFRFGDKGKGSIATLQTDGRFVVRVVAPVFQGGEKISSTRILNLIRLGDVQQAADLMGHPYQVRGVVIPGRAIGRTIGFPTANIRLSYHYRMPKEGVYFGRIYLHETWHQAVMNYGVRPSVDDSLTPLLEVHVLGFSGDLVGEVVSVTIEQFARPEMKFASLDELKAQIARDVTAAYHYFNHTSR